MSAITSSARLLAVTGALSIGAPVGASTAGTTPAPGPRPVSTILQPSGLLGPGGPLGPNGPLHGGGCIGPNVNPTSLGPDGPLGPNGPLGPGGVAANRACKAVPPSASAAGASHAAPRSKHANVSRKHGKKRSAHRKRVRHASHASARKSNHR